MSLASELAAEIRALAAQLAEAREVLDAARERITEAMGLVQTHTDGTSNPLPGEAMMHFQAGTERLNEAEQRIEGTEKALEAYVTHLMGGSGGPSPTSSPAPQRSSTPHGSDEPNQQSPKTTGMRRNLQREEVMKRIGWPTKPGRPDDIRARGVLYGAGKKPVWGSEDDPLWANRFGLASQRTDLKPGWANGSEKTSTWHIEGNVAAWMVKHQRKDMVLYINQSVCGMRENVKPDPERCGENVKHVLPKGYTLYVHSVLENGTVRITRHRGTGKAIKDEE